MYLMKTTTNKTLATLNASLSTARDELLTWIDNDIPTEQKRREIAAMEAQIAKLTK